MSIGERLRQLRGGISQLDFATKIGVNKELIGKYERGLNVPGGDILSRIHDATGVSLDWLISGKGNMLYNQPLSQRGSVNEVLLELVIQQVEQALEQSEVTLTRKKKVKLIAIIYELIINEDNESKDMPIDQIKQRLVSLTG